MPYFVLGIAILVGLSLAARWYVSASAQSILRVFKWTAIIGCLAIIVVIILTRQLTWAAFMLPAMIPWLLRARQASRTAKNWSRMASTSQGASGMAPGQTSEIETRYLRMYLAHDSGEMNGDVILGQFSGKTLRSLSFEELIILLGEVKDDNHSIQVLVAYMERYHEEAWRESKHATEDVNTQMDKANGSMTISEAYKVLGLEEGAKLDTIKESHRRLMSKLHPDHGGSTYLATKLNEAKDLLLNQ